MQGNVRGGPFEGVLNFMHGVEFQTVKISSELGGSRLRSHLDLAIVFCRQGRFITAAETLVETLTPG